MKKIAVSLSSVLTTVLIVGGPFGLTPASASAVVSQRADASVTASIRSGTVPTPPPAKPDQSEELPATGPHALDLVPDAVNGHTTAKQLQAAPAEGTSVITGSLYFMPHSGSTGFVRPGVVVTAYLFDSSGQPVLQKSVVTDSNSEYVIDGLAAGKYYLHYFDNTDSSHPQWGWFGETATNPWGDAVLLLDGQTASAYGTIYVAVPVSGRVSCEQCASGPDPASTRVVLTTYDFTRNIWVDLQVARPDSEGRYSFSRVLPIWYSYQIVVWYNGADSIANHTLGNVFAPSEDGPTTSNVLLARNISPVSNVTEFSNSIVNALYWDYLGRRPSPSDVSFWGQILQTNYDSTVVARGFVTSDEYRLIRIDSAYRTILGREPDANGRLDWLRGMRAGVLTTDDIETSFYASQEYFLQHGATNDGFIGSLYSTLLHRSASPADLVFWAALVHKHGRIWVVAQFWQSTETIRERVGAMYEAYLGRSPDPSGLDYWVSVALQLGDSGLRASLTSSSEYLYRASLRFALP